MKKRLNKTGGTESPAQGPGFFATVYEIVARIPAGQVMTYGQVAALAGRPQAARFVGMALGQSPGHLKLPCHRVVNRLGEMAPGDIFHGLQRRMLEDEGVAFDAKGRVVLNI